MVLSGRDPTIRPRLTNMPGCITDNRVLEFWYGRHPLFPGQRTIRRARRILAEKLNRQLATTEHAHHKNGNTLDDRKSNIELMLKGEHASHHNLGRKHSPESKMKMSLNNWTRGKHLSPEIRAKLSLNSPMRGKHLSPEDRVNVSRKLKEAWKNPEYQAKMAKRRNPLGMLGKKLSVESRAKISESIKRHWKEKRRA